MLSQPTASTVTIFSEGTQALADAAEAAGVRRFVAVSAAPVGVDPERLPLAVRMVLLLPHLGVVYDDMERMEADLTSRDSLDWTIIRPAVLSDGRGGSFRIEVGDLVPGGVTTSRIDLALLLVQTVETDAFIHERVALAD
jgi:putative NADH-flavin reductase